MESRITPCHYLPILNKKLKTMKRLILLCWGIAALVTADEPRPQAPPEGVHGYALSRYGESELILAAHEDEPFVLMSVVKVPLAVVVLHEVEQGRLSLEQRLTRTRQQLDTDTWSPLLKKHPGGGNFSVQEWIRWSITESDNNACNVLFELVGGPEKVQDFFRHRYGKAFPLAIACSEEAFKDRRMMEANRITPRAMVDILQDICRAADGQGDMLRPEHARLLLGMMETTPHGASRLKGGLSPAVRLAHKTGSSGTDKEGFTLALNDVGVMILPDGSRACIASFVGRTYASMEGMEAMHAGLARRAEALLREKRPTPAGKGQ